MKNNIYILLLLVLSSLTASAQFPTDPNQTFFVCNDTLIQSNVRAFADGKGGTYSFWMDQRNGRASTCIYGQHLDSLGFAQWATGGKNFYTGVGQEMWVMDAVPWQSGFLIAWEQSTFGSGPDTLLCNYYDSTGTAQWAHPVLVAGKLGNIYNFSYDNLNIYANPKGANITFAMIPLGGNTFFSFNHIDLNGNLSLPLDSINYPGNGDYYATGTDHHGGFYVAAATGGLGSHIYVGHYDKNAKFTFSSPVDVSTVAGGRAEGKWNVISDTTGTGYIVWGYDYMYIAKIDTNGTLPWGGGGAKLISSVGNGDDYSEAIVYNDTIYAVWDDNRTGAIPYDVYMQKIDTAGNMLWTPGGIKLCTLNSYDPYPKVVGVGTNMVAAYGVQTGFRGQELRPDSSSVWQANGVEINNPNPPFYNDFKLVATGGGNVTAVWSNNADVMAARVRPDGTLTGIQTLNKNSIGIYPNPATNNFIVQLAQLQVAPVTITIYNSLGALVQQQEFTGNSSGLYNISTENLAAGLYFVKVNGQNYYETGKICVVR